MERSRLGGGGSYAGNCGYSRRCLPGDSKSNDRHRLLTDRAAYISYLEESAEKATSISLETQEVGRGLQSLQTRMEDLEEKVRSTSRSVELLQDHGARAGECARAGRFEIEDQVRIAESRVQRLEQAMADARAATDAEMARLRNEVALAVQDLGQRVDDRLKALRAWHFEADENTSSVIREAQATCVRLADDALGAVEISQQRLDELSRRTDGTLDALRVDVTGLRAELAGITRKELHGVSSKDDGASSLPTVGGGGDDAASRIADAVERRLGARMGQQFLQLSEVLRRVVQAQATLHQQVSGATAPHATPLVQANASTAYSSSAHVPTAVSSLMPAQAAELPSSAKFGFVPSTSSAPAQHLPAPSTGVAPNSAADDAQRRIAIDELYAELRRLEECDSVVKRSSSPLTRSAQTTTRRSRNLRAARSGS